MHDIDQILSRIDLPELADELVGGRKGHGTSAKWPSPVPGHPQTGQSPPMGIYTDRQGIQRWKDFATGQGGTAIDLYMTAQSVDTKTAIEQLATRTSSQPIHQQTNRAPAQNYTAGERHRTDGTPRLTQWVQETNKLLQLPKARLAHRWLADHGIDLDHAVANNVGYDPGATRLRRGDGLPRSGPAVVLPITNNDGDLTYAQSRSLRPGGPKYINPKSQVAVNPTISILESRHDGPMFLTEGVADALVLTQHGHNASALIGTGMTSRDTWVQPLTDASNGRQILLAFDNDPAGHSAAQHATHQLHNVGHTPLVLPVPAPDISDWANRSQSAFGHELTHMARVAEPAPSPQRPTATVDVLHTIL